MENVSYAEATIPTNDPYKLLVESVKDYTLIMLDLQGKVKSWNRGAQAMQGYTSDEIIGAHFARFYTPEDLVAGKPARVLKAATESGRFEEEGWRVRKNGTRFRAHVVMSLMIDDQGVPCGFAKNSRNLTERNEAEARQRSADEQFRLLVERVEEYAIFMLDCDGRITTWNTGAQNIKGYRAEEILGHHFECFYPADERSAGKPQWLLEQAISVGHVHDIGPRVRKDGTIFQSDVVITAIYDKDGKHRGFAEVTRDITEQRRQIESEKSKLIAEAANRAKDHFLAVLSHELRTPLTPVLASVSFMEMQAHVPDDLREELACIRRNVEMEVRLIDDLLDMTSINRAKLTLRQEAIDVSAVLKSAVAMYIATIVDKKLNVNETYTAGHPFAWADAARLRQVFWNLIGNAIKFTPVGGTLTVSMANDAAGDIKIEVSDTGIGIAPAVLHKVFNAFEQGEQTANRRYGGLGLGLTISKALIDMHGGTIAVQSGGLNQGTTFSVTLKNVESKIDAKPISADFMKAENGSRILLVEDHPDTLRVMKRLLSGFGHQVTTASSVLEAVSVAEQGGTFDLLISDIGLPDGTGWDIMRKIASRSPIKGIALSGFGADNDVSQSREAGFVEHLTKPIDSAYLQEMIQKVLAAA